ncbi:trehalose-phosphatase [Thermodesulfovibrio yellowstonii]|uniref:Trehalose 6-phosphate phosphatase n=1 Tax=Thermodesulfovibrio yellowstonii TaxID=28262 RepID=A0A9W6LK53_9BACT|nr:trehalose-phosphatase [Thermodesulfovibrio islandicus]GLI52460.1 hypothetical protein TISLANDTSLP1_01530 [Thermodesulfovibrio islandicus]
MDQRLDNIAIKNLMTVYLFHSNWFELIKKKKIFILFDFDGTLVPLMKNPDDCYLPDHIKEDFNQIKKKAKIGIISGRDLEDLKKRISVEGIYYSGSHGLQIEGPDIKYINSDAERLKSVLDEVYTKVKNLSYKISGTIVERKSLSFALHYRQVDVKLRRELKNLFFGVLSSFGDRNIKILKGKMVFEVLPAIDWNKGKTVSFILEKSGRKNLPIFVGDDITDETVFKEIKDEGLTVRIGYSKKTLAKYFLKNQSEVYKFLKNIREALNV